MKTKKVALIFEDPYTEKHLEGLAEIFDSEEIDNDLIGCNVLFTDEDETRVYRIVAKKRVQEWCVGDFNKRCMSALNKDGTYDWSFLL